MNRRWAPIRLSAAACAILTAAGCSMPAINPASILAMSTGAPASTTAAQSGTAVAQAVRLTIDAFNATAGGPVAGQQAELGRLLSPGQQPVQRSCPAATTTIRFEPVYARLAPSPSWRPTSGSLPGDVYALPTLIRIYAGDRMTGTDLTDLHVAVHGGHALLPALCLG